MSYTLFSASDRYGAIVVNDRVIGYDPRVYDACTLAHRLFDGYDSKQLWSYMHYCSRVFAVDGNPWVEICISKQVFLFGKEVTDEDKIFSTLVEWAQVVLRELGA